MVRTNFTPLFKEHIQRTRRGHDAFLVSPQSDTLTERWIDLVTETQQQHRLTENCELVECAQEIQPFADTSGMQKFL